MRVVFLLHPQAVSLGSSVLRGVQLADLVRCAVPDRWSIEVRTDIRITDAVVFVTKGALARFSIDVFAALKARNVAVLADFVDAPVRRDLSSLLDGLVVCSHRQRDTFRQDFPRLPTFFVTHCVDTRLGQIATPQDRLRLAYFGERVNARFPTDLGGEVEIIQVNTAVQDFAWAQRLSAYNAHYGLRAHDKSARIKPFMKGFVAAHCGCPIVTEHSESDAAAYLPADYPFFVEGPDLDDARVILSTMRRLFGGPEWLRALHAMREVRALSAPERTTAEFLMMLRKIW